MNLKQFLLFFIFLLNQLVFSQKNTLIFNWEAPTNIYISKTENILSFSIHNGYLNVDQNFLPEIAQKHKISNNTISISISNLSFELTPLKDIEKNIIVPKELLSSTPKILENIVTINNQKFASIKICGLVLINNEVFKVSVVKYDITENKSSTFPKKESKILLNTKSFETGNWHKFGITETGIHVLSYQDLKDLNIINFPVLSDRIKIYGSKGALLPYLISDPRHGLIEEMAIEILDGGDNTFNDSDSIIFYAEKGSNTIFNYNSGYFKHNLNHYSDSNFVFLTFNDDTPKRIQTINNLGLTEVQTITKGDFVYHHEKDSINFIKSGRMWIGESISDENPKVFNLKLDHDKTENIILFTNLCSRSLSADFNSTSLIVNEDTIGSVLFPNVSPVYYNDYVKFTESNFIVNSNKDSLNLKFYYQSKEPGSLAWIDYFTLLYKKELQFNPSQQLFIKNAITYSTPDIYKYNFNSYTNNFKVWDITNFNDISSVSTENSGTLYSFKADSKTANEFIVFDSKSILKPVFTKTIENQKLDFTNIPEYLIISHPEFISEANRLANFHKDHDGLKVSVVNSEHIYNEFSSGRKEAGAIRDYIRYLYNNPNNGDSLKYVLLMGNGSFDPKNRINNNKDFIPTYQSENSIKLTSSYASDDFYGVLDSLEGDFLNDDQLDISIGRLPVKTLEQAKDAVDKIYQYYNIYSTKKDNGDEFSSKSSWRNNILFVADDGDNSTHFDQAEKLSGMIDTTIQNLNIHKVYIDAYPKQKSPSGGMSSGAKKAVSANLNTGMLIVNYTGHGGEDGWSSEKILEINDIYKLNNKSKLPLVLTATCEFSRYDDPGRVSAGELLFLEPNAGAIALFTTTRLVFSIPNFTLNRSFYEILSEVQNTQDIRLGDLFRKTKLKNNAGTNDRNFTLLGDPALRLTIPKDKIIIDSIVSNSKLKIDTLNALTTAKIYGHIENNNAEKISDFNGIVEVKIFDKKTSQKTLDNEGTGNSFNFETQTSLLFRGNLNVSKGDFNGEFIIPKNILYNFGKSKISTYAYSETSDAKGNNKTYIIGGEDKNAPIDNEGPSIEIFIHDSSFTFGGTVPAQPYFIAKLSDENGINIIPNNIGKNLTLTMNKSAETEYVLNNFYETNLNTFKTGVVQFQLSDFKNGSHNLEFLASDNYNNTSKAYTEFIIEDNAAIALEHILNYPNPFTTNTGFYFEHNQNSGTINVSIQIYTITGKVIKTINTSHNVYSKRIGPIEWNGLDDFGDQIGKGVYIYKLKVETDSKTDNEAYAEQIQKLVILK